jgi:hypothetical protein
MTSNVCPDCGGMSNEKSYAIKIDIPGFSGRVYSEGFECIKCGVCWCSESQKKEFFKRLKHVVYSNG